MIASQKVFNYDPELFEAVLANGCIDGKAAIPLLLLVAIIKVLTEHAEADLRSCQKPATSPKRKPSNFAVALSAK